MEASPCGACGSTSLRPKWMSETGEKWVHCDQCGNHSFPMVSNDRQSIIGQWNKEQSEFRSESSSCPDAR